VVSAGHKKSVRESGELVRGNPRAPSHDPVRAEDDRRVAHVLYQCFISEKRHDLRATAARMSIDYNTLDAYCTGDRPFPRHRIIPLWRATRDVKLISDVLGTGDEGLTLSVDPAATEPDGVRRHAMRAGAAVGALQATVDNALEDERIEVGESKAIDAAAEEAERQIETTKCAVRKLRTSGASR
jgi:hypothetical protein